MKGLGSPGFASVGDRSANVGQALERATFFCDAHASWQKGAAQERGLSDRRPAHAQGDRDARLRGQLERRLVNRSNCVIRRPATCGAGPRCPVDAGEVRQAVRQHIIPSLDIEYPSHRLLRPPR